MVNAAAAHGDVEAVWALLQKVADPEIPVLSICDLGIVRKVRIEGEVQVTLTPTYAGCPATHVIEQAVLDVLRAHGYAQARVTTTLSPPWSTDWISPAGRAKLQAYGIAPPAATRAGGAQVIRFAGLGGIPRTVDAPACPQCGSLHTELLSQFGSTACKALYRCLACREPFDYFKPY